MTQRNIRFQKKPGAPLSALTQFTVTRECNITAILVGQEGIVFNKNASRLLVEFNSLGSRNMTRGEGMHPNANSVSTLKQPESLAAPQGISGPKE